LYPLTRSLAKPAVPFGGSYRIVDFTLSNCVNSDLKKILILTQYKALELNRHIREGWSIVSAELGEFIEVLPPMKRVHEDWYRGTADAVYQNLESILDEDPELTLILSADHIYKMDFRDMITWHRAKGAEITIATTRMPHLEANRFGVLDLDRDRRVRAFEEKPQHEYPDISKADPSSISVSMGIYVFSTPVLKRILLSDAQDVNSSHDFGKDILPKEIARGQMFAYEFRDLNDKTRPYWRDIGTLDAYYEANMDLVQVVPEFNLYDENWPIRTRLFQQPPAKFVFAESEKRMGVGLDSIISAGCIVSGGRVTHSVLSPGVRVESYCEIDWSILMTGVRVGRHSRIRRAIIPPFVCVPEWSVIGFDPDADRSNGYTITETGVVVVPPVEGALAHPTAVEDVPCGVPAVQGGRT
jgi:glucose-1-phosphate adenylyltransferase